MRAKEFITEALTPEQTAKLFKDLGAKYDANIHSNVFGGKTRIYVPLNYNAAQAEPTTSPIMTAVQAAIQPIGFEIKDYKAGLANKIGDPNRLIKIGKLLKDQNLLNQFARDPIRAAAKQTELEVVFSRDAVDIAGMSTDRGWVSCMDLAGGCNKHYVPAEIKNGAIIAYLIRGDDKEINNPLARILMKPYFYKNHMIIFPDDVYGTAPPQFKPLVDKFCQWANSGSPEGDYRLKSSSYQDSQDEVQTHFTPDSFTNLTGKSGHRLETMAKSIQAPPEALLQLASSKYGDVRESVAENPNTPPEALDILSTDEDEYVTRAVAKNLNTAPATLAKLALGLNVHTVSIAVSNPNLPPSVMMQLTKSKFYNIRYALAGNPRCPPEVLAVLLNDKDEDTRHAALTNENLPMEMLIAKASKLNVNSYYTESAITSIISTHKNKLPIELLCKFAKSAQYEIKESLIDHLRPVPQEVLLILAKDKDEDIRNTIASDEDITIDVAKLLCKDRFDEVRVSLASNEKCPPEILAIMAADKDSDVLGAVMSNDNCPEEILRKLAAKFMKSNSNLHTLEHVAYNAKCPTDILAAIAETNVGKYCKRKIARHLNTSSETLLMLSKYHDKDVANAAKEEIKKRKARDDSTQKQAAAT